MPDVRDMYNAGDLAFLSKLELWFNPPLLLIIIQIIYPVYFLISTIQHWQSARANERVSKGWGGYIADLGYTNTNDKISMNVSLSGNNIFQNGLTTLPFSMNESGPTHQSITMQIGATIQIVALQ